MAFHADAFVRADLTPRTKDVPVPGLKAWFDEGEQPIWRVRALTANELARANSARDRARNRDLVLSEVAAGHSDEVRQQVRALLGMAADEIEPNYARAVEVVMAGSVAPECSEDMAVKLAEHYPVILFDLNAQILTLTGLGSEARKKPEPSSATPPSATP